MLRGLEVRDLLIIDHLSLEFQPGLNVLTGETGAGKSILLDALGFVLGWRGRAELVREGAQQGEVTAWFDLAGDHPARGILEEAGLPQGDELILRRVNTRDGRKTAWVNDRRASGEVLRALSDRLIELHGQHDDRGLLNTRGHRALLDTFGGLEEKLVATGAAWRRLRDARRTQEAHESALSALRKEEEFLRHAVGEFNALMPEPGEDAILDTRRRAMQAGARVGEDVLRAARALGHEAAEAAITDAARWLEGAASHIGEMAEPALATLTRILGELGEAQDAVAQLVAQLDHDPAELERVEERLFAIRALARKHDVAPDELADLGAGLARQLAGLDAADADGARLAGEVARAQDTYDAAARSLARARAKAAQALDRAMAAELAPLKMERAVFTTDLTGSEPGPEGDQTAQFTVATNPGAPAGALNKIASGGELSRFLLALKVCLSGEARGVSMIFDEIDRGVGGATANAVGRRLSDLARQGQVLVVTHSPQVAALGDHHWQVTKSVVGDQTRSTVVPLGADDRVDEIARMLAGDTITQEARGAARALLEGS